MESELDMAEKITNRIKQLRGKRGWTQQQLAEAVGVSLVRASTRSSATATCRACRWPSSLPSVFECADRRDLHPGGKTMMIPIPFGEPDERFMSPTASSRPAWPASAGVSWRSDCGLTATTSTTCRQLGPASPSPSLDGGGQAGRHGLVPANRLRGKDVS